MPVEYPAETYNGHPARYITDGNGVVTGFVKPNTNGDRAPVPVWNSENTAIFGTDGTEAISAIANSSYYKVATFGDSRANISYTQSGSIASGNGVYMDRVASNLARVRPDIKLTFNGGVSGDTVSNWDGSRGSSKTVEDLITAAPDAVIIQYGINDIIGWNGSSPTKSAMTAQTANYLKSACAAFMGSGIFVIFESINTAAQAAATYINGYSSAGGFGANYADKLDILTDVNAEMETWLGHWRDRAVFVDTSSVFSAEDGYAKTDGTYYDGTHGSGYGGLAAALLVDSAIRYKMPPRTVVMPSSVRNAVNGFWTNPTNGLGENVALTADSGTWAAETYSIDGDEQIINFECTALTSGYARRIVDLTPLIIGAGAIVPVAAGDVYQGRALYAIDDGAGGAPNVYGLSMRLRIYYDDATNEYVHFGQPGVTTSTDFPRMPAHSGALLTPGLAIKAGKTNSNITTSTRLQVMLFANSTGLTRIKLRNVELRKVA